MSLSLRRWLTAALLVASAASIHAQAVPTPESVFGHTVGADYKLIDYTQSIDYFRRLAATSNKIRLVDVGKTSNGIPWTLALISSPENLAKIDRLKGAEKLAQAHGKSPEATDRWLELLLLWWRDVLFVRTGCDELVVNRARLDLLRRPAAGLSVRPDWWILLLQNWPNAGNLFWMPLVKRA
jgi:hypothetical protein